MQNIATNTNPVQQRSMTAFTALPFGISFLLFCLSSALLISWKPLHLSIATIFLFAGPHNWMEFRFFLTRVPLRWGKSKSFYAVGLGGVFVLTIAYLTLYALGQSWYLNEHTWTIGISIWNTAFLMWLCALVWLRGKQSSKRDWSWIFAFGFALAAFAWALPIWFSLVLIYLHPLVALWFLDRQLKRTRPQWRKAYHICLAALPLILVAMWTQLVSSPHLPNADALASRITHHAEASILTNVSSHLLVATHVFLETVHYGVWIVLIPLVGLGTRPFDLKKIPLVVHREGWPKTVKTVLAFGILIVFALWICFHSNYALTRDIYFAFAIAHVLAEAPFLIRLL